MSIDVNDAIRLRTYHTNRAKREANRALSFTGSIKNQVLATQHARRARNAYERACSNQLVLALGQGGLAEAEAAVLRAEAAISQEGGTG